MNIEDHAYDNYVNRGDVVYDIGAHIGSVTCRLAGLAKKIYAFEPSPFNYPELQNNTKHLPNVETFNVALNEKEYACETEFRDCAEVRLSKAKDEKQKIVYCRLDSFIREKGLELPNFIKMDIEGMESVVLNTLSDVLSEIHPIVFVEIHAQAKGVKTQSYENNPHWLWPEDGGFNFNCLKEIGYSIKTARGDLSLESDWNPASGSHCGYILIPKQNG